MGIKYRTDPLGWVTFKELKNLEKSMIIDLDNVKENEIERIKKEADLSHFSEILLHIFNIDKSVLKILKEIKIIQEEIPNISKTLEQYKDGGLK